MSLIYEAKGGREKRGGGGRERGGSGRGKMRQKSRVFSRCVTYTHSLHTTHMRAPSPCPRRWHSEGEDKGAHRCEVCSVWWCVVCSV